MSDLKQKTKIGIIWNILEKIAVQGIGFVLNIILARLLTPHDYGTVGMLTIFLTFSNVFIDSGFSRALIQKQDRTEKDYSTVLIFNIAISIFIYIILFFASPAIAQFYKTPELLQLQRVFFLVIILNSLTVVQNAQLQINVDFKHIAIINSFSVIISGIIAIIAAYNGLGSFALVIQTLSKALISAIMFWIIGKWVPKTGFSKKSFKNLFGFGSKLLVSGLLSTTITNVYNLVIGKVYSPTSLGYYTRAQQFPEITSGTIASVLNTTTFPLMSSLQNNKDELANTLKKLIKMTSMIVFPAMIGLACLSEPIILVLLGEKWLPASNLLFWISLSYIFTPLSILNMNVLNAIGRSDLFLKIDLIKIPFIILTMIITFPISMKAIVIGKAVTAFLWFYINGFLIGKFYNFGSLKQLLCCWKYIVSAITMGLFVIFIDKLVVSNVLSLILGLLGGVFSYILLLIIFKDVEFYRILKKLKGKIKCKK
ncbi:MAG: lipopolysaccharide biosynthesis protein [Treponemataceae bacterium]|nr:lipopolysaccharide biosynthesis protein [Treponemataceae bacterium]